MHFPLPVLLHVRRPELSLWLPVNDPDEPGGWWHVYQLLLKDGRDAPAVLAAAWSQPAHVRLQPAVRYTRPLWQYFRDHSSPATAGMIESLGMGDHLPEGPDPEIHPLPATADARDLVESILSRWKKSGLCDPSDVLILHAQSDIAKTPRRPPHPRRSQPAGMHRARGRP